MRIYVTLGQIFVFSFLGDSIIVLEATEIEHLPVVPEPFLHSFGYGH